MWRVFSRSGYRWVIIVSAITVMLALWLSQLGFLPMTQSAATGTTLPKCVAPDATRNAHGITAQPVGKSTPLVDMCVLVIAANGQEADLSAITQALDYLGTPYAIYIAVKTPGGLTAASLSSGEHAFYQGIILATSTLGYLAGSNWLSALSSQEWNDLNAYEAKFGIRQVSWYTYPTPVMGFQADVAAVDTATTPVEARFTAAGQSVFSYVNTGNPLTIRGGILYQARSLDTENVVPLLRDPDGNALALVDTYDSGQQNLALTFDGNASALYSQVLSYGLINWVTRGLFLGERHVYLTPQVDDFFIPDRVRAADTQCAPAANGPTSNDGPASTAPLSEAGYRISPADLDAVAAWQQGLNAQFVTKRLRLTFAFNGFGTSHSEGTGQPLQQADPLTQEAIQLQDQFYWVSHTFGHIKMDTMSYADARAELLQNDAIAKKLGLTHFTPLNLVTPEISGLDNVEAMRAAYVSGVRYIAADPSRRGESNPSPNAGYFNQLQPSILMIPRYPTNLGYDVGTPQEWVSEYNCIHAPHQEHKFTYQEILDKESQTFLTYMLEGNINPMGFHQTNLHAYDGQHFLLGDVLDATLAKYEQLFNLPVSSLSMDALGRQMATRTAYNAADIAASMVPGHKIILTTKRAVTVPITGLHGAHSELYGGQYISYVHLSAGQAVTLPLT